MSHKRITQWGWLLGSVREYKKAVILTPLLVMGEVVFEALIPYEIALLVNAVKAGAGSDVVLHYGAVLTAMALCALFFGYAAGITCAQASCGLAKNLRQDLFYHIQGFSFRSLDKFSSASLVTRLTTDVQMIQMAFMLLVRTAFRAPFNLLFSFFMAYYMGGFMASVFLLVIPFLGFGMYKIARISIPLLQSGFPQYDAMNEAVEENIKGIRAVKSFVREQEEIEKFNRTAQQVRKLFTRAEQYIALNNPLMQLCMYGVMVFLLTQGSRIILQSKGELLDIGQFATLLTYSFQILGSLMMVSMIFVMLTFTEESLHRVREVMEERNTLVSPDNPVPGEIDGSLAFDHVSFRYSEGEGEPVLEDLAFTIRAGETIGIVGGTGSGKSSLVQLIPRLYDVTGGSVLVGGRDVRQYDLTDLRGAIAMVLQKNLLFSGTVADNLRWGNPEASLEEMRQACHWARADEFIEKLPEGYEAKVEQGGNNFSGGQKQRLCLARALLKKPKILILDDSTSAVDSRTEQSIWQAMRTALPGTTKLIIAQRLSSVEKADRILVLDQGKVAGFDTHERLLAHCALYRDMAQSQNVPVPDLVESVAEKGANL